MSPQHGLCGDNLLNSQYTFLEGSFQKQKTNKPNKTQIKQKQGLVICTTSAQVTNELCWL